MSPDLLYLACAIIAVIISGLAKGGFAGVGALAMPIMALGVDPVRGAAILRGVRGRPPADVDALVDVVLRVQRLGLDLHAEVAELDVNPLVLRPRGEGAVALDAWIVRP